MNERRNYEGTTGRRQFNESYLFEMPENLGVWAAYPGIFDTINELIRFGKTPIELGNGLKKIELETRLFYWIEIDNIFAIGAELFKMPESLIISITGKNPKFKKKFPFASDLYLTILNDAHRNIVFSDDKMSEEGFGIWERLFKEGHKICLYDKNNPTKTFQRFQSLVDLKKYFQVGKDFRNYQYVLSESLTNFCDVIASFHTRKYREDNNLGLDD